MCLISPFFSQTPCIITVKFNLKLIGKMIGKSYLKCVQIFCIFYHSTIDISLAKSGAFFSNFFSDMVGFIKKSYIARKFREPKFDTFFAYIFFRIFTLLWSIQNLNKFLYVTNQACQIGEKIHCLDFAYNTWCLISRLFWWNWTNHYTTKTYFWMGSRISTIL